MGESAKGTRQMVGTASLRLTRVWGLGFRALGLRVLGFKGLGFRGLGFRGLLRNLDEVTRIRVCRV